MRRVCICFVLWAFSGCINIAAQATPLATFESIDGIFRFVYPETYDLLIGERMLKATQGKNSETVCDFATAIACVIYPFEQPGQTRLQAGVFSVSRLPDIKEKTQCLAFSDKFSQSETAPIQSVTINRHEFRVLSTRANRLGRLQMADYYRTFRQENCYELKIEVRLVDASLANRGVQSNSIADEQAATAREALGLILSSFTFQ